MTGKSCEKQCLWNFQDRCFAKNGKVTGTRPEHFAFSSDLADCTVLADRGLSLDLVSANQALTTTCSGASFAHAALGLLYYEHGNFKFAENIELGARELSS